ncbi:putative subtilisin-like serine protease [Rosellinia necatrix]|uniref:Putative subtilisin-like serine protease n=1 Tax=Rosellinia necatrix TaxID=77044 RepID=A0A1S8A4N5_ROSNE|nr:putative subtilisin-like serine protease [Rosellinia necatrix]
MYSVLPFPGSPVLEKPRLPGRVLQLIEGPSRSIRLIEPAPGQSACYFALSHRWGTSKKLLLTRETLKSLQDGIPVRSLPGTYRDAVQVTGQFGCSFLWIDSLCIFQDDIDAWLAESTKMADIFRQATCVIAAHSANDDNEGFLSANWLSPKRTGATPNYAGFHECVNESNLSKRGWVFQERILARRLLHFTDRGLFLEDASGIKTVAREGLICPPGASLIDNKLNVEDASHSPTQWYRLIERYSHCELTWDIDRLPAIAGLARAFGELTSCGRFLFGLWSESIHFGLLWRQTSTDTIEMRDAYRSGWRCPTWSWGAWKGSVHFPPHLARLQSSVRLVQDKLPTPDIMTLENPGLQSPTLAMFCKVRSLRDVQITYDSNIEETGKSTKKACWLVSEEPVVAGLVYVDGISQGDKRTFDEIGLLLVAFDRDEKHVVVEDGEADGIKTITSLTYYYLIVEAVSIGRVYRRIGTGTRSGSDIWRWTCSRMVHLV